MAEDKKLNKEQLKAVKHKEGPLLIIAGAGTGKTTVVTERIKFLISKALAKPSEILALTFTEKAAREMEERVDITMPYGYTQMWISTFHSFCDRILRQEALHIGLDPRYKLMTQAETTQFVRKNLFKFDLKYFRPLGNPTKFVGGMLQHFSRLQDEDITPNEYLRWVKAQNSKLKTQNQRSKYKTDKTELKKWKELAKAYKTYDELKVKEGLMDFGDLIVKTLILFRQRPNILKEYKLKFKYVLVDEFQDTNYAQNELAMLLAGRDKDAKITVTGDDNQSIYRFRGAAVSNILQFKKAYPDAKVVTLRQNYRSTQKILDHSYKLIQFNNPDTLEVQLGIDKNLVSVREPEGGKDVKFIHKDRVENEAEEVVRVIKGLTNEEKYDFKDIAILVRANNHSGPFIRSLQRHGIPYQFLGPGRLFRQSEIVDLISYLKVLYDYDDSVALYRILSIGHFDITARDLIKISNYARRFNLSLFEACDPPSHKASEGQGVYGLVSEETREKIKKIIEIVNRHLKLIRKETAGQLLYFFLQDTGLLQKLLNPDSAEAEKKAANISKFFDKLKTYEVDHEDATVTPVVDWIELSSELGESPLAADIDWVEINAVNILTAHSAKGLEFPIVFLVNLVSARFPTVERREQIPIPEELIKEVLPSGDYHEQEERRLFYVGMTRAMDHLYFTAANYYGEGKREKRLSPFIFEALGDEAVGSELFDDAQGRQLSFLDYSPPEISVKEDRSTIHIDYLSYSQIDTFRICPLHYKLRYILKIPTPPSAALSFGSSMHTVMKDFYLAVKQDGPTSRKASRDYRKLILSLLKKNWIAEGYSSKSHERKMFKRGKSYLREFLKKGFNAKNLPVAVEQPFVVPLHQIPSTKHHSPLKIGGKIDRVDNLSGGKIEIIDYKTGEKIPEQRFVDKDLQLTFYALAASSINEFPFNKPAGVDRKPKDIKLSLYYFKEQTKVSTVRTKEQLEEAKKEIFEWRDKIENSEFRCSGHMFCKNCEYSLMCRTESD
jgi:DNA helicase-2/ATP-dependent DNA helicase PcrA